MEDNSRKRLYDKLSESYNLGTFEEFDSKMGNDSSRRALYDKVTEKYNIGTFEEFNTKMGNTHKQNLDAFNTEYGSFMNNFESRDSAETKMSRAGMSSGLVVPVEGSITGEERQRYLELHKQEEALKKAWYNSPDYLAQRDAEALLLSQMRDSIDQGRLAFAQANPMVEGYNPSATRGAEADKELQMYETASRIMQDVIKLHNAPSKYDGKNAFLKFGKGSADTLSDLDFWTAGLTEITDNFGVRDVLDSVQSKLGNLNDLSEEAIEDILSPAEKAVLQAWALNAQEQVNRKDDLARAYQAGQSATESLGYMAEFALTGGVGKAASEGVETMAKWLGRKVLGQMDDATAATVREAGEKIAKSTVGKYGARLADALAETAGKTFVMPSTFRNISEKAAEIQEDAEGNRYLTRMNDAFAKGFADSFIENLSEGGRVNAIGDLIGDVAGKIPAYKKIVDKFANSKAGELLSAFNSSGIMNTLRAGGWHGFGEEYLEEWYGNALRTITGLDKEALKDFATVDNQLITITSFLPMTIFGGTVSTAQVLSAKKGLDKKAEMLRSALLERGYDEKQADNMIDMMRGASPAEISQTLTPIVNTVALRDVNEAAALMKPVGEFAEAVRRWQAFDTKYQYQEQERRDNLRNQMTDTLGQFWQEDENGRQIVQRGVNANGEVVYLLGKPSATEAQSGAPQQVAAITSEGRKVFVDPSAVQLEGELEMNDFLGNEVMAERGNKEQARMIEEKERALAQVRQMAAPGTAINLGTTEAPMVGTVAQRTPDGVVVTMQDGSARQVSYEELGNYIGVNTTPLTDAQMDESEADALVADKSQREAELDQEYENLVSSETEIEEAQVEVEQAVEAATPLPTKADGSVDQTALWNNDPVRWAQWNDEQRQDGGVNSLNYINGAIAREEAAVAELTAAYNAEPDFDTRASMEQQIAANTERLQRLVSLQQKYAPLMQAEAQQVAEGPEQAEQVAPRISSQMSEQVDEQYDGILRQTRIKEERVRILQEYLDKISEGSFQAFVLTSDNYADVMRKEGCSEGVIAIVGMHLEAGENIGGFTSKGKLFLMEDGLPSIEEARITYIHERQHVFNTNNPVFVKAIASIADKQMLLSWLSTFVGQSGLNPYRSLSVEQLADEVVARCMEIAYTTEDFSVDLQSRGIPSEVISIIKDINNEQREDQNLLNARRGTRRDTYADVSGTGSLREDGRNIEQVSGGILEQEAARPSGISEEGVSPRSTGEGAEPAEVDPEALLNEDGFEVDEQNEDARFSVRYLPTPDQREGIIDSIVAVTGRTRDEAERWLDSELSLASIVLTDQEYLDYAPDAKYKAIKDNSDYPQGTVDFNNICRKRKDFTRMYTRLQRAYPNRIFTAEDLADIRTIMSEDGLTVACGLCYVEDRRQKLGEVANAFIEDLQDGFRNYAKKGATKKANAVQFTILVSGDTYIPSIYDLITLEGSDKLYEEHRGIWDAFGAYNRARGQQTQNTFQGYAEYKREILTWSDAKVKKVNSLGGLRIFSYSDFEAHHLLDIIQIIIDCAARGVMIQGYTKVPEFARVVDKTGIKLNRSLIPLGDTGIVDGKLAYDPVEGIDTNDPNFLESNDNVGNILIGINDEQIRMAMADPFIHYIIPYHARQAGNIRAKLNVGAWTNYIDTQNERKMSDGKRVEKNINIYTDVLNESITNDREFVEKYLEVCREKEYIPKFDQFLDKDAEGNYVYTPGYYKFLVDFKLFDEAGNILPQKAVVADFDDAFNAQVLNDYAREERETAGETMNSTYDKIVETLDLGEPTEGKDVQFRTSEGPIDILEEARKIVEREDGVAFRVISDENYEMAQRIINNLAGDTYFRRLEGEYELGKLASNYAELADIIMAIDANKNYTPVGTALLGFFAENPEMHYPLLFNDSKLGKETAKAFADELSKVDDPYALFFMKEAWRIHKGSLEQAGLGVKPSSTTKFNKAVDARAEEIKAAEVKGTAFNFKKQESSLDEIDAIFKQLNKDPELALLHDRVMSVARTLGVKVSFAGKRGSTAGESLGDKVSYDYKYFNSPAVSDQSKCNTITHELIHSITVYAIYLRSKAPSVLSDGMLEAVDILHDVYNQIARDPAFKGEYGVSDVYEMVAELSNAQFRDKLKEKNLFQRILDALKRLLGIDTVKEDSAYQVLSDTLDYIIDNYDQAAFDAYALYASKSKSYGRMMKIEEAPSFRITPEQDKAYMDAVEAGDMETAQRMVDEAAAAAGYTIRGDHGRVSKFTIFDRNKANPEGNWGQGFYFSNNEEDVENNYATVEGPDLENKIEREVERRINQAEMNEEFNEDGEVDEFAIREAVESEFITSEPNIVHAAIKMNNPFVVGHGMVEIGEDGLGRYDMQETYLTAEYETDEDGEIDYDFEPTGTLVDLVEILNDELSGYEWVNINAYDILANNIDGMTAGQFEKEARELLSPYIDSLVNDNGEIMSSEIIRAAIERAGFDGIVDNTVNQKFGTARRYGQSMDGMDGNTRHYIAFQPSQIKETDPVTYDNDGNVIPLSERFNPENEDIRFRMSNENQAIFVSNAARAVEGIKQEKATPEQWLKMVEKAGGLKAGEDKWMGLSDWLKASDKKTLTKQEVLDFINENMIIIEEEKYGEVELSALQEEFNEIYDNIIDNVGNEDESNLQLWEVVMNPMERAWEELRDRYSGGDDFDMAFSYDSHGNIEINDPDAAGYFLGIKPINDTRLDYTTSGLQNKQEIALVVPNIEPWNERDEVHFGDAGDGRAVAWIRFGETEVTEEGSLMDYEPKNDVERDIKSYIEYAMRNGDDFNTSVGYAYNQITDAPSESVGWTEEAVTAVADGMRGTARTRKILVIDEIQSRRHQEGREKGYLSKDAVEYRKKARDRAKKASNALYDYIGELVSKYPGTEYSLERVRENRGRFTEEENTKLTLLIMESNNAELDLEKSRTDAIPDAPFDKNWHELAMKRMLRYAAENGYDVIAWTKGDQQANRYDLSRDVKKISVYPSKDGSRTINIHLFDRENDFKNLVVDSEGIVTFGEYKGRALTDVVGKETALKIMGATRSTEFAGDNLRIGGEGMRGFYDKMLPAFMNKYGKKWGVKVEDIDLPNLGKYGYTMHSVPVTEEMKASVMEGQVMFRVRGENESAEEFYRSALNNYKAKYTVFGDTELFPINQETADRFGYTLEELENIGGVHVEEEGLIAIFVHEDATNDRVIENAIFHEDIHWISAFYPYMYNLGEWLWNNAGIFQPFANLKAYIEAEYDEDSHYTEMLAYAVSNALSSGDTGLLESIIPGEYHNIVRQIENEIGYDRRAEESHRSNGTKLLYSGDAVNYRISEAEGLQESKESAEETRFRTTEITPEVRDEMAVIAATALVNGNYMKAPNGADTNLTAEQWAMVRTKNFKAWFGEWENDPENASKVVDENGEPKVVFHGSNWRPVLDEQGKAIFKMRGGLMGKGAYFTDNINTALYFAADKYEMENAVESVSEGFLDENGYITEVFLNIRNEENIRTVLDDTYYLATSPSQIKSATDNTGEFSEGEDDIRFSIRTKPAPEKTGIGYKVFYLKDGKLYPPMVANQGGVDTPVGVWLDAEEGTRAGESKTGRPKVKQGGKGTQGGSGTLAYRPGWHLGEIPYAIQFNRKDENGNRTLFPADFVWAEVEYANDMDYQEEAMSYGMNANGKFQHSLAGLPKLPTDGSYRYRTNPNPETDPWIITGAMKVNRLLTPSEVDQMVIDAGREPQKRQEGAVTDTQIEALNKELGLAEEEASFRVNENPTEAQKEAGNYKMGHLNLDGYRITIENPKGSVRRGTDSKGNAWENTLNNDYGYIRGTEGVDGDHIDVYLSDNPSEGNVFVIDQVNPETREFDEHKVMYGFNSAEEAREAYLANFSEGWNGLGTITEVSKDEFKKWIQSSHRKTKPFSEYKSVRAIGAQSEGEEVEDDLLPVNGTPTEDVVAEGVSLSPAQLAFLAGDIFAALPEESRKKITDGLNGNIFGLQDAILQIPTSLAMKESWNEEDKQMADVVAAELTKMAGEMTRPFSASEGLWVLYNALNPASEYDILSQASRALVQRNLGFDPETLQIEDKGKEGVRFRTVGDAGINATASLYNRGAVNVWTRIKESFVDMNASVEKLVKAIEKRSGKAAEGFENVLMALNQQSSKGLAAMESYEQRFLKPMYDKIRDIMNKTDFKYEDIVRYVILKHGLERNEKMAQRDAKAHYQEIYDDIIAKIKGMNPAQKRTYLTNAQLRDADAKAELARLQAVNTSALTPDQMKDYKKEIAKAKKDATEAAEHLARAQKIASMTEQDAQDELDKIFKKIEKGTDSVYKEMRKNDYSGISSMFYDQLGVNRKDYSTEEEYQAALMQAKADKYDNLSDIEGAAQMEVTLFENAVDTKDLWKSINSATKETLRQQYEANMISKDQYLNLRDMFEYYVPLRGFKDNTAEDMYTYYRRPNSTGYTKPILGAEGRKTEAESPFGWIAAMAGSAIASNVKNEAKLALYYFVANRPDNGVATLSRTWFVHTPGDVDANGKKIFRPAYPPFNNDLSSASAKADYEIWQANMRDLQKQGLAYEAGQRLNLGNAVVNISDTNKPEHIVNVKVGGKDYTIVINGNPRAAQAINGDLNIEATAQDYSALFGPVLRWMSSVNTSYNPEFWITNLMRDMAFTWMAVNTKEDPAYRRRFSKNYRKAFKVIGMVAKNEKGTLGNEYIEQMYQDFVKYGGVTGYTQIKDNETWEKEIEKYIKSNAPDSMRLASIMKGTKDAFHAFHRFGESLEQVSRFAAFLTSREMGKSIPEAINDAKEITVNFNRKGSGKMITLEEAKYLTGRNGRPLSKPEQWAAVAFTSISPLGRRFIMFFNAAIQGLNATYKLWKKNPSRFGGWVLAYTALGVMNATIHALLDDDDDYLDMPQYERRTSLMIGYNGAYLKWALPQEAKAFYALGDLAVESIMGRNPHQNVLGEAAKIVTELSPINPTEGWRAFLPSIAIPAVELMVNKDYKGDPIYNDQKWLSEEEKKRTARWSKAYSGTGKIYVSIAKGLNALTGGDEYDAGLINLQPEKIQHIVQSAFGGTIRTADKFVTTVMAAMDPEEDVTMRQFPFLNRILTINDERFKNVHVNDVYDYYKADAEHALTLEKQYKKNKDKDALNDLWESDEYQWAKIYKKYKKPLEKIQEKIKVAEGTAERKDLMKQQDQLKKDMIKEISELP